MGLALPRLPRPPSTQRSSSCAERWIATASSPIATTARESPADHLRGRGLAQLRSRSIAVDADDQGTRAAGVAAVLINPSHTYPDLAFFIDVAEERVFNAINGERACSEVLQSAAMSDEQGRQLFRRLWEHDLIVFDAERP